MITIKATCPGCGEVPVAPEDVELRVHVEVGRSWYAFTCPDCCEPVRKAADERVVALLLTGGVRARVDVDTEAQARAGGAARRHTGPPISYDDLLDFHHLLDGDDWFDAVIR